MSASNVSKKQTSSTSLTTAPLGARIAGGLLLFDSIYTLIATGLRWNQGTYLDILRALLVYFPLGFFLARGALRAQQLAKIIIVVGGLGALTLLSANVPWLIVPALLTSTSGLAVLLWTRDRKPMILAGGMLWIIGFIGTVFVSKTVTPNADASTQRPAWTRTALTTMEGRLQPYHLRFPQQPRWFRRDTDYTQKMYPGADTMMVSPDSNSYATIVVEEIIEGESPTMDSYEATVRKNLPKTLQQVKILTTQSIQRSDVDARVLHVQGLVQGFLVEGYYGLYLGNHFSYTLWVWTSQATFDTQWESLFGIATSMELPTEDVIGRPAPPRPHSALNVRKPVDPARNLGELELPLQPRAWLQETAALAYKEHDWQHLISIRYWLTQQNNQGRYELAQAYALANQTDGALYWLQQAALEEGFDPEQANQDPAFGPLLADPRWASLEQFMVECAQWWTVSGHQLSILTLPSDADSSVTLPLVVALHEDDSEPNSLAGPLLQTIADSHKIAILSVSGAVPLGKHAFRWSDKVDINEQRIALAIRQLKGKVTVDMQSIALLGIGEGAQTAMEVAASYPSKFRGAVVLAPRSNNANSLAHLQASVALAKSKIVLVRGGNASEMVQADSAWLARSKTHFRVEHMSELRTGTDHLPDQLEKRLPEWIQEVLAR
jgi:predicted esterase